ncbi:SusD/RagB family nutrient-binding outer membrane lipoprotein [Panacibacter sp. DH6]|uniref:SusD/RagB family nutrient-binding outer membrane lipoprotein n=1 Tax=Panacibacter microcysteis TaxID=2793269 RepID=A0A931GVX6_9BACT|nr:SusD/RagB family nutrient-binding outer membrane lipoprotein [Panacibacter microcysteis]MBG9376915.1 SusD/RagB family nutrient-binding outer membrane lipoprotein [Panacibacter microcysteis]
MKKIQIRFLFTALVFSAMFAACNKDYLDVNKDPNRPTDENITPELLFTQAATAAGFRTIGTVVGGEGAKTDLQFAQNWVGYMGGTGDFAVEQIETTYNIDFAFGDVPWQRDYGVLFDLYLTKTKALANDNKVLAGAAMIISAKMFQELADTYGDIPYSQAFQTETYKRPAYDKAEDIYVSLQASLDSAISYMQETAPASFATVDVVNHGDQDMWIKFANTLKLRMLIRQSEVPGFTPTAEIAKIEANGGVIGAGESISVNPGFNNAQAKQSPFYGNYGFTPTGNKAAGGYAPNNYILSLLLNYNDPRTDRFFTTAGGFFVGSDYGLVTGNPTQSQASYFGPGVARSADQDQWLIPSFEGMFFEAEAIARGWMAGDARAAYEAAVTESFVWLGVEDAANEAALYMTDNEIATWDNAGATVAEQADFIALQKYIALTTIDPREAWADERRLHFLPDGFISNNPGRIGNSLPLRLLYPQSEYTTNNENVSAVGDIDQFTTKIFWQP